MHKNKHSKYLKIAVYCIVAVLAPFNASDISKAFCNT